MSACIEVKNVTKGFAGRRILENVSLSVPCGKTVGLIGANGSGKSVLFQIICGILRPDSGSVAIYGVTLGERLDFPANMGVFINSPGFIGIYSGFKNLQFLANIRGEIGDVEIRETMRRVGLDPEDRTRTDNYSLGMKQKLGLAQAIMENQEILILDEPFNALDFKTYNDMKEIVRLLQAEGRTILLTSHHHDDIEELCDDVYVIDDMKITPFSL